MKTHRITIDEKNWKNSPCRTRKWEERVHIVRWEHDYINKKYNIEIKVK